MQKFSDHVSKHVNASLCGRLTLAASLMMKMEHHCPLVILALMKIEDIRGPTVNCFKTNLFLFIGCHNPIIQQSSITAFYLRKYPVSHR